MSRKEALAVEKMGKEMVKDKYGQSACFMKTLLRILNLDVCLVCVCVLQGGEMGLRVGHRCTRGSF